MKDILLSIKDTRGLDRFIIDRLGTESLVLMENAGRAVSDLIEGKAKKNAKIAVFCGRGNNGGDGFVVARHLLTRGFKVDLFLIGKKNEIKNDARVNLGLAIKCGLKINELTAGKISLLRRKINYYNVIVDALLGIGLKNEVRGITRQVIDIVNLSKAMVVAVDVPSGLDADTGFILGACVLSDFTVTFLAKKRGFLKKNAVVVCGKVIVESLGFPIKKFLRKRR
ncbi:MAG: NAD(P)H-hydrate epimerase [Candidatus Gygaella obscura]|nr:NAD(P)H-hydrate epimerase [Candidatus Gygaella obscura]